MNITPVEAHTMMANKDTILIDVREHNELANKVPSSIHCPMSNCALNELPTNTKIIFICRSGARSEQVVSYLRSNGYEDVFNLQGGMIRWMGEGLPTE